MRVSALTDVGMRRRNNQDSFGYQLADGRQAWERHGHMFVVADGMGAHAAGELASRLAVDLVQHHYGKCLQTEPVENLRRALIEANHEIHRRGQANIEFRNMGTTCSALALLPEGAVCAHVGDSRVYRVRGFEIEQLTFDHSLVWEMQAVGGIQTTTDDQLLTIPKNVITRSLGPNPHVAVDIEGPFSIKCGDRFLLCSDGLSGQLTDTEIGVLLQLLPIEEAARTMLDLANLRGGPDNITLIAVEASDSIIESPENQQETIQRPRKLRPIDPRFIIVSGIGLSASVMLGMLDQWLVALTMFVISCFVMIAGLMTRGSSSDSASVDSEIGQRGRGPYRRYVCHADAALVQRMADTIEAILQAARENQWLEAITTIEAMLPEASQAARENQLAEAIQRYSKITIEAMKRIRLSRAV